MLFLNQRLLLTDLLFLLLDLFVHGLALQLLIGFVLLHVLLEFRFKHLHVIHLLLLLL